VYRNKICLALIAAIAVSSSSGAYAHTPNLISLNLACRVVNGEAITVSAAMAPPTTNSGYLRFSFRNGGAQTLMYYFPPAQLNPFFPLPAGAYSLAIDWVTVGALTIVPGSGRATSSINVPPIILTAGRGTGCMFGSVLNVPARRQGNAL
jgi:hypothetical protein